VAELHATASIMRVFFPVFTSKCLATDVWPKELEIIFQNFNLDKEVTFGDIIRLFSV
jgi:hypothetical protein